AATAAGVLARAAVARRAVAADAGVAACGATARRGAAAEAAPASVRAKTARIQTLLMRRLLVSRANRPGPDTRRAEIQGPRVGRRISPGPTRPGRIPSLSEVEVSVLGAPGDTRLLGPPGGSGRRAPRVIPAAPTGAWRTRGRARRPRAR